MATKRVTKKKKNDVTVPLRDVIRLVYAASAARDTFDTLRRGVHFSGASYDKGYTSLRTALAYFEKYRNHLV